MVLLKFSRSLVFAVLLVAAVAFPAAAHIDADQAGTHLTRYGAANIKQGPCGLTGGERGTNIYTYEPGETITVSVTEYIGHPGYFRIAFDDDGDDDFVNPQTVDPINRECMPDPADKCGASDFFNNDTVLMDNLDPHDYPPFGMQPTYTWEVTLPDVECDNCTLQILQVMTDPPGIHAPYDPSYTSDDLYYQCIDLVLKRGADGTDDPDPGMDPGTDPGTDPAPGMEPGGAGMGAAPMPGVPDPMQPADPATGMPSVMDPAMEPTTQPPTTNPTQPTQQSSSGSADSGGCAVGGQGAAGSAVWLLLALAALRRRSRR
ncbi:MAG: MYXO-CTERM sorting domain-containing protein [Myxococcales bacterium]|nr:MYXO-CTERM sorting domain-containing protein [Myxococcales bacterium]